MDTQSLFFLNFVFESNAVMSAAFLLSGGGRLFLVCFSSILFVFNFHWPPNDDD